MNIDIFREKDGYIAIFQGGGMAIEHRQLFKYNTQCRLNVWTRWTVVRVPHANLCMLRSGFFLMFKH